MSKLAKAPLVEVVFELRWRITNSNDLAKVQYLYGDLYAELKQNYPFRESIVPAEIPLDVLINQPVHRFRAAQKDYPLFQVGPGILTFNTIDKKYFWDKFYLQTEELISAFFKVYPAEVTGMMMPGILFVDFFPLDFNLNDAYKFVNEKFNVTLKQSFFNSSLYPNNINFGYFYKIEEGELSITFQKGKNSNNQDGILLQTRVNGIPISADKIKILEWLNNAHSICSDSFKKLIKGELYETFK